MKTRMMIQQVLGRAQVSEIPESSQVMGEHGLTGAEHKAVLAKCELDSNPSTHPLMPP